MGAIVLYSPHSPEECAERLRLAVRASDRIVGSIGSPSASGHSVRLRKRIWYRNSFQTFLRGRLEAHDGGTRFRGRAGVHTFVFGFMAIWFGALLLSLGFGSLDPDHSRSEIKRRRRSFRIPSALRDVPGRRCFFLASRVNRYDAILSSLSGVLSLVIKSLSQVRYTAFPSLSDCDWSACVEILRRFHRG